MAPIHSPSPMTPAHHICQCHPIRRHFPEPVVHAVSAHQNESPRAIKKSMSGWGGDIITLLFCVCDFLCLICFFFFRLLLDKTNFKNGDIMVASRRSFLKLGYAGLPWQVVDSHSAGAEESPPGASNATKDASLIVFHGDITLLSLLQKCGPCNCVKYTYNIGIRVSVSPSNHATIYNHHLKSAGIN